MKLIEAIQSWVKGQKVTATILNVRPIGGTLFVEAKFYYALLDENLVVVADGNIDMTGKAYQDWGKDDEYIYTWAASKDVLNLTIIGDYVPSIEIPIEEIVSNIV